MSVTGLGGLNYVRSIWGGGRLNGEFKCFFARELIYNLDVND